MTPSEEIAELQDRKTLYLAEEARILQRGQSGQGQGGSLQRAALERIQAAIEGINVRLRELGDDGAGAGGAIEFLRSHRTVP